MKKTVVISPCLKYRYILGRIWEQTKCCLIFVGLNPSTLDANIDDTTIKRCMYIAENHGYGGILMLNLFAYITKSPSILISAGLYEHDIIGNNEQYLQIALDSHDVCLYWGTNANNRYLQKFHDKTIDKFKRGLCLGINADGSPKHPLYLKKDTKLIEWNPQILNARK